MSAVLAIGFDLDHTLAIDNRLERVALLRLLEVLQSEGGRTLGTLADEIDSIDALLACQRRGEYPIDEAVRRFVAEHGVAPSEALVETFRRTAVAMVDDFLVPLPGVKPLLETLRERGIPAGVLTNGWNPLQARKVERLGFRGPVLVSSDIGEQKPALRAFDALVQALATPPESTWYVGDDPQVDVAGAQRAGMPAVWLNWERKEYPAQLQAPNYVIRGFDELLALLPQPERVS
jgi:putative hydrolase of the HAD superfamily